MVLYGANTYTGVTTVNNGTLEIAGGSIGVSASAAPNIQISPNTGDNGTLLVSNGTVYADRVIIGGNVGNTQRRQWHSHPDRRNDIRPRVVHGWFREHWHL